MRDRSRQFPHHAHPVDVRQIRLELTQLLALLLGAFEILDVRACPVPLVGSSIFVPQWHVADQEPAILPIGPAHARFGLHWLSCRNGRVPFGEDMVTVFGMYCCFPTPT